MRLLRSSLCSVEHIKSALSLDIYLVLIMNTLISCHVISNTCRRTGTKIYAEDVGRRYTGANLQKAAQGMCDLARISRLEQSTRDSYSTA